MTESRLDLAISSLCGPLCGDGIYKHILASNFSDSVVTIAQVVSLQGAITVDKTVMCYHGKTVGICYHGKTEHNETVMTVARE